MKTVGNYDDLSSLRPREGMAVLVLSTRFLYRYRLGTWLFLGREPEPLSSLFEGS